MKILTGKFRGRNFYMPAGIRPSQNITRKAVFDILGHELEGVTVLDLFAGSGAVGLEALSGGADKAVFVEKEPKCVKTIQANLDLLGLGYTWGMDEYARFSEVIAGDAFASIKLLAKQKRQFDLVFADPPYGSGQAKKALKTLEAYDILHANCLIAIEHRQEDNLPDELGRFSLVKRRSYGKTFLSIYQIRKFPLP